MSNDVCRYLTNGLRVQSWYGDLAASPCCYIPQISLQDPTFTQQMQEFHARVYCNDCRSKKPPIQSRLRIPDVNHTDPVYIELSIDTRCNAACLSCNDYFSSTWKEQNQKFQIRTASDYPDPQIDTQVVHDLFNQISFRNVTCINFFGGEPMVSGVTELVLQRLVDEDLAPQITLIFTTNASKPPRDRWLHLLTQFQKVEFLLSIDGIEEQFEYLRWPLKWAKVQDTIDSIQELHSYQITVSATVSALSIFGIHRVQQWAKEQFKSSKCFGVAPCAGIMSLNALPYAARHLIKSRLPAFPELNQMMVGKESTQALKDLQQYLDLWDRNRRQDWRQVFPDAVIYLDNRI